MHKLLFFIDSLNGGGAERALINLVWHLDPQKYEITVMTLYDYGVYKDSLPQYVCYKSASVKPFRGINYLFKLVPPQLLYQYFVKDKYDLEISFLEGITTKIISGSKCKKVAWVRIDVEQHNRAEVCYFNKKQIKKCYKRFDKIAFVGEDAKTSFVNRYNITENLYIVRNIFECKDMIKKSEKFIDLSMYKRPIFVSVGRLEKQKGYERLLKVHKRLMDEGEMFTVLILGTGSLENILRNQIDRYKVSDTFHLLGFKSNPFKYMKNADWYISSSLYEGFSSVIREATLLDVPIIATDCSGIKEVLGKESDYGILVDNTEEGLYNGIKKIVTDQNLQEYYKSKISERKVIFDYNKTIYINQKFIEESVCE